MVTYQQTTDRISFCHQVGGRFFIQKRPMVFNFIFHIMHGFSTLSFIYRDKEKNHRSCSWASLLHLGEISANCKSNQLRWSRKQQIFRRKTKTDGCSTFLSYNEEIRKRSIDHIAELTPPCYSDYNITSVQMKFGWQIRYYGYFSTLPVATKDSTAA